MQSRTYTKNFELLYYANGITLNRPAPLMNFSGRDSSAPEMESLHKRFMRRGDVPRRN